jgi:hypothetical protein
VSISECIPAGSLAGALDRQRDRAAARLPFPDVAPGQLWLLEVAAETSETPALVSRAIATANVIIYDRVLADVVARLLPMGGYAEPVPASDGVDDAAAQRCVRFARDGWSVARLMAGPLTRRERTRRVRDFAAELAAAKVPGGRCVTVLAETPDGVCEEWQVRLDDLDDIAGTYPRDARLTIAVDPFGGGSAAGLHAVAVNGLAG